jgi:hypothetical protein
MKRGNANKFSAIIVGVILAIFCAVGCSSVQTTSTTYDQSQTATGESDKIKTMLLRPGGWIADWKGPGNAGESVYLFEIRGEKVVAKISNIDSIRPVSCERDVVILSDVVKYNSCGQTGVTLQYDPNDQVYPFKGKSPGGFEYKFKAK